MRDDSEIEITLKPMNITEIHKKEVKLPVSKDKQVGEFAQMLVSIMGIKQFNAADCNFLCLGKTLDHGKTFAEQNVQNEAKIIFTIKRKIAVPTPVA